MEVALEVGGLTRQLLAAPVVVGSSLAAGLPQWLGVALAPLGVEMEVAGPRLANCSSGGDSDHDSKGGGSDGDGSRAGRSGSGRGSISNGEESVGGGLGGGLKFVRVHIQV